MTISIMPILVLECVCFHRRRMKLITREISQTILPKAKTVIGENSDKSHAEICDLILQLQYVSLR